jgi:hypothetical protein
VAVDGGGAFGTREIDLPDAGPAPDAPSRLGGTVRIRAATPPSPRRDVLA